MTLTHYSGTFQAAIKTVATANTPQTIGTTSGSVVSGNLLIAILASDNLGAVTGRTNEHLALTVGGQGLSKIDEHSNGGTGAATGVTCSVWTVVPNAAIASGATVAATFSGAVAAKALTISQFTKDTGTFIDLASPADVLREAVSAARPGEMIINAPGASRQILFVRGFAGETSTATQVSDTLGTYFTPITSTGGASDANIAARGSYRIATASSYGSGSVGGIPVADWSSIGFALYERSPQVTPDNFTLLDNFNRANALLVADLLWSGNQVRRTGTTALGINSNQLGSNFGEAVTTRQFGPDLDLIIDVLNTTGIDFKFLYNVLSWSTATATGYYASYDYISGWGFWTFSGLSSTGIASAATPAPVAGDQIWLRKRGTIHQLYLGRGGVWNKVLEANHGTYSSRISPVGIEVSGSTQRYDNFSGGTVSTPGPRTETLIDHFNRANGNIGAVAPWDGLNVNTIGNSSVAVASNTVVAGSTLTNSIGTSGTYGPDQDLLIDCVTAMPGTGGNEYFGIYFCMANTNSANSLGYLLSIDNSPKWQIYRYTGFSDILTPTSSAAIPAAGDTLWIARRGSSIKVYVRRSGTQVWTLILDIVDDTFMTSGKAGLFFYRTGASSAWDNFRGGTIPSAPSSTKSLVIA